jgi:hypothetical protein
MEALRLSTTLTRPARRAWSAEGQRARLLGLAGAGLALELVLVVGLLIPFNVRALPDVVRDPAYMAVALGMNWSGALRYIVPVLGASAAFAAAWWVARGVAGRRAALLVLGGTTLFSATMLPVHPLGSSDVYHYVAGARTLWVYGENPSAVPPSAHPDDPWFRHLWVWQNVATDYGPVWYLIAGVPLAFVDEGLWPNVIGQKALSAAFLLGTTALVMLTAARLRPGTAAAAGVLVGWNPLLQWETAGNAHNDIVMAFFGAAALYAVVRRWWVAVFPLLFLSVASKYTLVLLGPVLLIWLLRRRDVPKRDVVDSLAIAGLMGAIALVLFYREADVIGHFTRHSTYMTSSAGAVAATVMSELYGLDFSTAATLVKRVTVPLYLVTYAVVLWRIPSNPSMASLVRACVWTIFLLLVLMQWWFWPWYLLWLVPLAALLPGGRTGQVALAFSCTSLLMYAPFFWLTYENLLLQQVLSAAVAFALPVWLALRSTELTRRIWGRP